MQRSVVLCLVALAMLAWPSLGWANKSWPVYDTSGHRVGSIRKESATTSPSDWDKALATVWQNTTMVRYCGQVTYMWTESGRVLRMWSLWDTDGLPTSDQVRKVSANRYDVKVYKNGSWRTVGMARRASTGPWRLLKRVSGSYRRAGKVSRYCPGNAAAGGGRLLLMF